MTRIDVMLAESGLARSRTHARNLIELGKVSVNGIIVSKPATEVSADDLLTVDSSDDFASLGGLKLQKALEHYKTDVKNKACIDIGASNGGFTDVLIKRGAERVYAVDIGECALPPELQNNSHVVVRDKLNARYLSFEDIGITADIITIDVSFISLTLILPAMLQFMHSGSVVIALIKPQFEVGKNNLTKTGIVKSKKVATNAVERVLSFAKELGLRAEGYIEAPHPFENKNQEYLTLLHK